MPAPVLTQIVGRYGATAAARLQTAREHLGAGRLADAAGVLHTLRGSSAMLGAVQVEQLAAALEQDLSVGKADGAERALGELESVCAQTAQALTTMLVRPVG